ncbi:MAG: helix-turn-helix domain-containing protein [Clostridia bacterium]|nr:helix-turn-helix domain-containing protein [Clostridia bacterium]
MRSFFYKKVDNSDFSADRYIHINNFGYYEDITNMQVRRERGRLDYQLIYVKKGEILLGQDGEKEPLREGSVCLFRPKEAQLYSVSGSLTTYYWIHFSGREVEPMLAFFQKRAYAVGAFPAFEYFCQGTAEELYADADFTELLYEGRLIALIARIGERIHRDKAKARGLSILRPALAAMQAGGQEPLSNEALARLCGLSKSYFMKVFRDTLGTSPGQHYATLTVNKARYLLMNSTYNVGEIARLCGVEDSLYFSRLFKKHTGLSPREYRRQGQERAQRE